MNCPSGDENHVIARHPALRRGEEIVCTFIGSLLAYLVLLLVVLAAAAAVVIVAAADAVIFNVLIQKWN